MTITITEKEYDAISYAIDVIQVEIESAEEESFIDDATNFQSALYSIMEKYKKARYKAREFQEIRALVAEKERHLRARDIDKLARKWLKNIKLLENEK